MRSYYVCNNQGEFFPEALSTVASKEADKEMGKEGGFRSVLVYSGMISR